MIAAADGTPLEVHHFLADPVKAQVVLLHGYAEHAQRYAWTARRWNQVGISVTAVDLRGHGASKGARGRVRRFDDYHLDVDVLLASVDVRAHPTFLFGHSMGGLLALHRLLAAGGDPSALGLRGVVLSSPYLGLSLPVPALKAMLGRGLSRVLPPLSLKSGLSGRDVAKDPNLAATYDRDPAVFSHVNVRWFTEANDAIAQVHAHAGRFRGPMLVLYGGDDRVASADATDRFVQQLPQVEAERIEGLYHEILNEPEPTRSQVADRFSRWILQHR